MKLATAFLFTSTVATARAFTVGRSFSGIPLVLSASVQRSQSAHCSVGTKNSIRMMSSPAEFAKTEIASSDVVVFSKTYCPFCTSTKNLFKDMNIPAKVIELDVVENGDQIQAALLDLSGQRTVPNVFIKGQHLGGNDDTQNAARAGKLAGLLS